MEELNRFKLGQRVRTLVDSPSMAPRGFDAPAGTTGVVDHVSSFTRGYGVLLDGDPSGLSAYYRHAELEEES